MRQLLLLFCIISLSGNLHAQYNDQPPFTPAKERIESYKKHQQLEKQSYVNAIEFKYRIIEKTRCSCTKMSI